MTQKNKIFLVLVVILVIGAFVLGGRSFLFQGKFQLPKSGSRDAKEIDVNICRVPLDRIFSHPQVPTKYVSVHTSPVISAVTSKVTSPLAISKVTSAVASAVASATPMRSFQVAACVTPGKRLPPPLRPNDFRRIEKEDYQKNPERFTLTLSQKINFLMGLKSTRSRVK